MGCGSSSLKGEKVVGDLGGDGPPARKVKTNFTDVDFSSGAAGDRRGTMALAPDEQQRASRVSAEGATDAPRSPTQAKTSTENTQTSNADGGKLQPYRTLGDDDAGPGSQSSPTNNVGTTPEIKMDNPSVGEDTSLATAPAENPNPIKM